MKKSNLGKITMIMLSVFIVMFICAKVMVVWSAGIMYDGLANFFKLSNEHGGLTTTKFVCELFVLPVIWTVICLIYILQIGRNKNINRVIYAGTIFAILAQVSFYLMDCLSFDKKIAVEWVLILIGFLLSFIMLFVDYTKELKGKILYLILGGSLLGTVVNMIVGYKTSMIVLKHNLDQAGLWEKVISAIYYLTPLFGVIALVLVVGYILFPEKYYQTKEK